MMNQPIPFELSLAYTLIFFLAVLFGFWMGRMTVGEQIQYKEPTPDYFEDDEGDIFSDAMEDPETGDRKKTI